MPVARHGRGRDAQSFLRLPRTWPTRLWPCHPADTRSSATLAGASGDGISHSPFCVAISMLLHVQRRPGHPAARQRPAVGFAALRPQPPSQRRARFTFHNCQDSSSSQQYAISLLGRNNTPATGAASIDWQNGTSRSDFLQPTPTVIVSGHHERRQCRTEGTG